MWKFWNAFHYISFVIRLFLYSSAVPPQFLSQLVGHLYQSAPLSQRGCILHVHPSWKPPQVLYLLWFFVHSSSLRDFCYYIILPWLWFEGVTFLALGNGAPDIFSAMAAFSHPHTAGLAVGALFGRCRSSLSHTQEINKYAKLPFK